MLCRGAVWVVGVALCAGFEDGVASGATWSSLALSSGPSSAWSLTPTSKYSDSMGLRIVAQSSGAGSPVTWSERQLGPTQDRTVLRAMVRVNSVSSAANGWAVPLFFVFTSAVAPESPLACLEASCAGYAYTVCVNGKGSGPSGGPGSVFCDDNVEVPVGRWHPLTIPVGARWSFLTAANATFSYWPADTDVPGGDIGSSQQVNVYGCKLWCEANPACNAFTAAVWPGDAFVTCYMKGNPNIAKAVCPAQVRCTSVCSPPLVQRAGACEHKPPPPTPPPPHSTLRPLVGPGQPMVCPPLPSPTATRAHAS